MLQPGDARFAHRRHTHQNIHGVTAHCKTKCHQLNFGQNGTKHDCYFFRLRLFFICWDHVAHLQLPGS